MAVPKPKKNPPPPQATSNPKPKKKPLQRTLADVELIKSDVASFAYTLGLAPSSAPTSGFRKSGPINPLKPPKLTDEENPDARPQPRPLQLAPFTPSPHTHPKLPLMKAIALSVQWYADAEELEAKVLGAAPPPPPAGRERERVAAKKKGVAERLVEQYVLEYESPRRRSGDGVGM